MTAQSFAGQHARAYACVFTPSSTKRARTGGPALDKQRLAHWGSLREALQHVR